MWMNRDLIKVRSLSPPIQSSVTVGVILILHVTLLSLSDFAGVPWVDALYGVGFCMGAIPLAACVTSRWWPFLIPMPIVLLPVAGKTVRELVYRESATSPIPGWLLYFVLPMVAAGLICVALKRLSDNGADGRRLGAWTLMAGSWSFFLLNFAFFRFPWPWQPWPWQPWTGRTPSGLIYITCITTLTLSAAWYGRRSGKSMDRLSMTSLPTSV